MVNNLQKNIVYFIVFSCITLTNYCNNSDGKKKKADNEVMFLISIAHEYRLSNCSSISTSCRTFATKFIDAGDTYNCSFDSSNFKLTCQISSSFGESTIVYEYADVNDFIDESSCIGRNIKQKITCSGSCLIHCFTDYNSTQCEFPNEIIYTYDKNKKLTSISTNGLLKNVTGYEFDRVNRIIKTSPSDGSNCKNTINKYTYDEKNLIQINELDISQATGQSCSTFFISPSEITYNSDKIAIKKVTKSQSGDLTYFTNEINNMGTQKICK